MRIRVVCFDVYCTLLDVGPAPVDAEVRWSQLWHHRIGTAPRLTREEFCESCRRIIDREHVAARIRGVPFPEVFWPGIVREVLPELAAADRGQQEKFVFEQAQLWHTASMSADAVEVLRLLNGRSVPLGIASNAQPYTVRELDRALAGAGLPRDLFEPSLCFWSFAHGFSKPDPHVFRLLTARLQGRGIAAAEALMVGDRIDNDIAPAQAEGWQTWHFSPAADGPGPGGGWERLRRHLEEAVPPP